VLGFWGESGPQNSIVLGIWEETLDQNGVVYGYTCQTEASSTRLSLFSLFETETEIETNLLNTRSSPSLHGFLLQTSPRTLKHSSQTLKHPQRGHSLAPVDTTTEGTKKQSSKEKGEFIFPFSSVFFFILFFLFIYLFFFLSLHFHFLQFVKYFDFGSW
jgi:ABC-type Na+ efflux pump permease subunit